MVKFFVIPTLTLSLYLTHSTGFATSSERQQVLPDQQVKQTFYPYGTDLIDKDWTINCDDTQKGLFVRNKDKVEFNQKLYQAFEVADNNNFDNSRTMVLYSAESWMHSPETTDPLAISAFVKIINPDCLNDRSIPGTCPNEFNLPAGYHDQLIFFPLLGGDSVIISVIADYSGSIKCSLSFEEAE